MKELPLKTFDEIEDIIDPLQKNYDISEKKNSITSGRRMANTYKSIREIAKK